MTDQPKVVLALPTYSHIEPLAQKSLLMELANATPRFSSFSFQIGTIIHHARNCIARDAWRLWKKGEATDIFWWDSDMLFPTPARVNIGGVDTCIGLLGRLLARREEHQLPIVGGLCFNQEADPVVWDHRGQLIDIPEDKHGLVRCYSTGFACVLMKIEIIDQMLRKFGDLPFQTPMHKERDPDPNNLDDIFDAYKLRGEDIFFYRRLAELGISMYVDTSVEIGHVKPVVIGRKDYNRKRREARVVPGGDLVVSAEVPRVTTSQSAPAKWAKAPPSPRVLSPLDENPLVSVVVTNHNYAKYLEQCLESIEVQTYAPIEVVVVDDASTDDSLELLSEFGGLMVIEHAQNAGQPAPCRNEGLAASKGALCLVLDADDWLEPTYIEEAVAEFRKHPEASIVYPSSRIRNEVGEKTPNILVARPWDYEAVLACRFHNAVPSLFRREVWEARPFQLNVKGCEDTDFWIGAAVNGFVGVPLEKVLVNYRRHSSGLFDTIVMPNRPKLVAQIILNNADAYLPEVVEMAKRTLTI